MNEISIQSDINQLYGFLDAVQHKKPTVFFSLFKELVTNNSELATPLTERAIKLVKDSKIQNIFLLDWAVHNNCPKLIRCLIINGSLEQATTKINASSLCISAALFGQTSTLDLLIKEGVDVNNLHDSQGTILHMLVSSKTFTASAAELIWLKNLIEQNPNLLSQQDCCGRTPLALAIIMKKNSLVNLFIKLYLHNSVIAHGANPYTCDIDGNNLLHLLGICNFQESEQQMKWLRKLISYFPHLLDAPNRIGYTPIHLAAGTGNVSLVSLFIELGDDKDALTREGCTPLMMAAANKKLSTLELLIEQGANPNLQDKRGLGWMHYLPDFTPLNTPEEVLSKKLVKNHLKLLNQESADGGTPLHVAASKGNNFFVSLFIESGADKDALTHKGCTPLMIAALYKKTSTIDILIEQGANLDVRNRNTIGWMHYLVTGHFGESERDAEWLKKIIPKVRSILNLGKKDQFTLMQCAAKQGNTKLVERLISFGIPIDKLSAFYINQLEGQVLSQEIKEQEIDISQNHLNEKIKKYLLCKMSEEEFKLHSPFNEDGLCQGYTLLFGYYSSRGKMDEFFHSLEQISLWDGTEASLNLPPIYPEIAVLYPTLRDFFEQWTNDILLFQAGEDYFEAENLGQMEFIEKYQIVKKDGDFEPVARGEYTVMTKEGLVELLIESKDHNRFFSLINQTKDNPHSTGIFVSHDGVMTFYDSTLSRQLNPCIFTYPLAEALYDYFIKEYQTDLVSKKLYASHYEFK